MLLGLAALRVLLTVGDVLLGHLVEVELHELLLYYVLDFLHADGIAGLDGTLHLLRHSVDVFFAHLLDRILVGTCNGIANLGTVIIHGEA